MFDRIIQENKYPNAWKLAKGKTAHKKGERQEVTNCRLLSMLSIPGKLLEGQLCEIIDKHLEDNELISDKQWGFRKGRSTLGLLLQLGRKWKSEIDRGYVIGIIFIDFQKAFDVESHDFLSHELLATGISRNWHDWTTYCLCRQQSAVHGGKWQNIHN